MPAGQAAERLSGLLAGRECGWVLPPEEGDAQHPEPDQVEPSPRIDERAAEPVPPRSWSEDADRPGPGLTGLLPTSLRTGRLDPGRRGAVALVVVALLAAVVAGGVVLRGRPQEVVVPAVLETGRPLPGISASPVAEVVVSVGGKVRSPGVVRLPAGSRVDDAVRAAGGVLPGASTELLNLARKLVDGEQVLVGVDAPPGAPGAATGGTNSGATGLVDLNAASASDLDALPGIGPVLAQRIVDWRTENGRFDSVEQLREVTGIGEAKYSDLAKKVTV